MKLTIVEPGAASATGLQIRLEKGSAIGRSEFTAALASKGLAQLNPKPVSDETALRRAIERTKPLRTKKFSLRKGSWTIHLVYKGQDKQELPQAFNVKLVNDRPYLTWETPQAYGLQDRIEEAFMQALREYAPEDIGTWFRDTIQRAMDAVPLGGDWWFIPKSKLLIFRQIEEAIKSFPGYWFKQNDVTDSDSAAEMVLSGMREKAMGQLAEIEELLAENTETDPAKLNERTIKARRARVEVLDKLRLQMKRYEDMFHKPLLDLESKVLDLKNKISSTYFRTVGAEQGQINAEGARPLEIDDKPVGPPIVEDDSTDQRFRNVEWDEDDKPHAEEVEEDDRVRPLEIDED